MPKTVPENAGANSLIIGHSPPVMNPYRNIAMNNKIITINELQPNCGINKIQIAGPKIEMIAKFFLILVSEMNLHRYSDNGPAVTMLRAQAKLIPEFNIPFELIETPKTESKYDGNLVNIK